MSKTRIVSQDIGDATVLPADLDVSADNTTADSTTGHHGLLPKLGGGSTNFLRADGTWTAPPGTGGSSYLSRRVMATSSNANDTMVQNGTAYVALHVMEFYHDWDEFPATHFQISTYGAASEGAQTITLQLTQSASPTDPVSAGGDDLAVGSSQQIYSSGWVAVSDTITGLVLMVIASKGSNGTVDLNHRWVDIAFKIV